MSVTEDTRKIDSAQDIFETFDPEYKEVLEDGSELINEKNQEFWNHLDELLGRNLESIESRTVGQLQESVYDFTEYSTATVILAIILNNNFDFIEDLYTEILEMDKSSYVKLRRLISKYKTDINDARRMDMDSNLFSTLDSYSSFPTADGGQPAVNIDVVKANSETFTFSVMLSNSLEIVGSVLRTIQDMENKSQTEVSEHLSQKDIDEIKELLEDIDGFEEE